jgi:DNA-binding NarL/FixJ family response regulator
VTAALGERPFRVLLGVAEEPGRARLQSRIASDRRFEVCAVVDSAASAVARAVRREPDICVVDVGIPGGGIAATWEITARLPRAKVVVIAPAQDDDELIETLRAGAHGYLVRLESDDRLPEVLARVLAGEVAIPRASMARLLEELRDRSARRRKPVSGPTEVQLTSREWEVLDYLCEGADTADIAARLSISTATVRSHIASIMRKHHVKDRAALAEACSRG